MSASPQSVPASPLSQGEPLRQLAPTEWRVLLRLLEHFDAMPAPAMGERWLCALQRDDPALGDALQRLLLRRHRLQATRFLQEPVITPDSLYRKSHQRASPG